VQRSDTVRTYRPHKATCMQPMQEAVAGALSHRPPDECAGDAVELRRRMSSPSTRIAVRA
jgi:hypothetical protein